MANIDREVGERIKTGILIAGAAIVATLTAEILTRPEVGSRSTESKSSLIVAPHSETIQRSSASHAEKLRIPSLPSQR